MKIAKQLVTGVLIFVLFFLVGGVVAFLVDAQFFSKDQKSFFGDSSIKPKNVTTPPSPAFDFSASPEATIIFKPPAKSLTGKVLDINGEVEILKRFKKDYMKVSDEAEFVIGESLKTGDNSNAVLKFDEFFYITIGENSALNSISLLKMNFTVKQNSGKVIYKVQNKDYSINVRYGGAIIKIDSEATLNIESDEATLSVKSGNVTVGQLDSQYNTEVKIYKEGDEVEL